MILRAGIIQERIDCSQSKTMNLIINHALHRITENLHCYSPVTKEAQEREHRFRYTDFQALHFEVASHLINIIDEHTEICGVWIITTQVWMASFHAIVISFLYLLWCGIWKLVMLAKQSVNFDKDTSTVQNQRWKIWRHIYSCAWILAWICLNRFSLTFCNPHIILRSKHSLTSVANLLYGPFPLVSNPYFRSFQSFKVKTSLVTR